MWLTCPRKASGMALTTTSEASLLSNGTLIVGVLFLAVGVAVLDDYGVSTDEPLRRESAIAFAEYIWGNEDALPKDHNRYYGVAFELSLLFVERALGLEDSRSIHLSRHLLTHLFFLTAGFFCYLLVYRLFNNRLLALFAVLLFLLHPRLYAHSFFNTKDLPFLSMFMIALYLSHRALRRNTAWAFLLCGMGVAILTNIRIMGVMLFPAVLTLRASDFWGASGWEERKHILKTGGVFVLASALTLYGTFPTLWTDPVGEFIKAFVVLAHHPTILINLFQGELISSAEVPPHYIPTWFAITTPPVVLLLGLVGTAVVLYGGMIRPDDIVRNPSLRFGFLLLACFVLPIVAVVVLGSHTYNGWCHMYFLYAPACLLAVFGLRWLVSTCKGLPARVGIYGLVGIGVGTTLISMIRIHPHQQIYFNFLVDRSTPEYLEAVSKTCPMS